MVKGMERFDPQLHPRNTSGEFTEAPHAEADISIGDAASLYVPSMYEERYGWSAESLLDGVTQPSIRQIDRNLLVEQAERAFADTSYERRTEMIAAAQQMMDDLGYSHLGASSPSDSPTFSTNFDWITSQARYWDQIMIAGHETSVARARFQRKLQGIKDMDWDDVTYIMDHTDFSVMTDDMLRDSYQGTSFGATGLYMHKVPGKQVADWNAKLVERRKRQS